MEAEGDPDGRFEGEGLSRFLAPRHDYAVTRFCILRLLGAVYFVAFLGLVKQLRPLFGQSGLLPADAFLERVLAATGSRPAAFVKLPTLFLVFGASDAVMLAAAFLGLGLSAAVALGATNAGFQLVLWALYVSFVHVGQVFYGYGWEMQLVETGFLAVFLCPMRTFGPFPRTPPSRVVIVLFRWLVVRVMLGAGLIKLRGDPCWRDFSCLVYHFETQPIPNPLSALFHQLPKGVLSVGVAFTYVAEVVAPFFAFGPRCVRLVAGAAIVAFQLTLILSGNLSFFNWITLVAALACFDDGVLARVLPRRLRDRLTEREVLPESRAQRFAAIGLAVVVGVLSLAPIENLLSSRQAMNRSFEPFGLVNTYGAFGGIGRERFEVILEGTADARVDESTRWEAYELPCKPGDVARRPCVVAPYQPRLDWQMWFAALSNHDREPWIVHLAYKLLRGDRQVMTLFAKDPFPEAPPKFVRAELYRYRFAKAGEAGAWTRSRVKAYFPPVSVEDPELLAFLDAYGWDHP